MEPSGVTGLRRAAILVPLLGAVIACAALWQWSARSRHNTIQQLKNLPANSTVHLRGVVIGTDEPGHRFWIQDETGAIPIPRSAAEAGVHLGETVLIKARIAGADTPSGARSPGTRQPGNPASDHARLPQSSPGPEKHGAAPDHDGGAGLSIADAAPEVELTGAKLERDYLPLTRLALFTALSLYLLVLTKLSQAQEAALRRALKTTHAFKELSGAVRQQTAEAMFSKEIEVQGEPEIASLAVAFNSMRAELQTRDSARREAESRLQRMALIDDLTGLPNRRLLSDRLSHCLTRAQRDQSIFALLLVDLDGFKLINDSFGHGTGDALLAQVAQRLKARFRQSDTVARFAGDEFALILDDIQERGAAQIAAESLLELLKPPFEIDGHSIRVSASIGVSFFPDGNDRGQLLQQADCAKYAAKRNGKNRIVQFSDNLGAAARERLTLEGELEQAIANGEIAVLYQPEYDLATNSIVRFEALARWTHPKLGLVMPVSFIPVAEESGLIVPLGAYIMERACKDARAWQGIVDRPVQVAVNVSNIQFSRDSLFEDVADILHCTGLPANLLQIELTESAATAGIERAAELMRRLRRMGVSVAVDDFGTGYSCLSSLPKLPFDLLKLDRSFVNELMVRRETRAFVQSILTLAHDLQMTVVVEGVETKEQLSLIRSLGIDAAQGYLLGAASADPAALLRHERGAGEAVQVQSARA